MPKDKFQALANKIRRIYAKVVKEDFRLEMLTHSALKERMEETKFGKHAKQQSSIIGHMEKAGLLRKGRVYVEFGCGTGIKPLNDASALANGQFIMECTGELSNYVQATINDSSKFILVDRRNFRKKFDSALRFESTWERAQMDIKDLDLTKHTTAQGSHLLGMSKHLCGVATDLALRCLGNFVKDEGNHLEGVVIALCCHQICKYASYINPQFLEEMQISGEEFPLLCTLSTWATCGRNPEEVSDEQKSPESNEAEKESNADADGPPSKRQKTAAEDGTQQNEAEMEEGEREEHTSTGFDQADKQEGGDHWSGLSFEEREELGFQIKRILDVGRARYLQSLGLKVDLVYYVDRATSLENLLLLASR
ncbi:tRNA:m(4)X modification enzyme TRM13 [Rhizophlyctis rosea]|nr:tRNA:m(4)X modification enzyme TRM13 [Rhizophlyctis rosea]